MLQKSQTLYSSKILALASSLAFLFQSCTSYAMAERPVAYPATEMAAPQAASFQASSMKRKNRSAKPRTPQSQRKVIYNGTVNLLVDDHKEADKIIRTMAQKIGGWFQESRNNFLKIRVPAKSFESFIDSLKELGQITSKNIKASDVTEQFLDTELRLSNAQKTLARLQELYKKAKEVKDILLIEKEINRISATIESYKGKLKYWNNNIAFSTVTIYLNQARSSQIPYDSPFYWMNSLANDLNSSLRANDVSAFWSNIKVDWPQDFVLLSQDKNSASAMTADSLFVKITRRKVETEASTKFWTIQAKKVLEKSKLIRIKSEKNETLKTGQEAKILRGTHAQKAYTLVFLNSKDTVATVEIWATKDIMKAHTKAVEELIQSLNIEL